MYRLAGYGKIFDIPGGFRPAQGKAAKIKLFPAFLAVRLWERNKVSACFIGVKSVRQIRRNLNPYPGEREEQNHVQTDKDE